MALATAVSKIPISVSTLAASTDLRMDLYIRDEQTGRTKLYREAGYPLSPENIARLRERGIKELYIQSSDREHYQSYLRELADPKPDQPEPDIEARIAAVNDVVRDVIASDFRQKQTDRVVASAEELGGITADLVTHDRFTASDMLRVLHHDYATFTHSTNVSFYASMLAAALGLDRDDVQKIATGGLLHDLGKLEIDERILCKEGRLDEDEVRIVRMHPTLGFRRVAGRSDLCRGQLMMVYQHHERVDGGGYPVGCAGDDIHFWAKICTVVDVFEALTSHRPYRTPMPRSRAIELLQRDSGTMFEAEILECWTEIIQDTCAS